LGKTNEERWKNRRMEEMESGNDGIVEKWNDGKEPESVEFCSH
jgi:hypothetical protein